MLLTAIERLESPRLAQLVLRIGLAFVFVYAGISSLLHPLEWVGYVPAVASHFIAATTFLKLIAVYELVLAVWLLSGWYVRYAALLAALTLMGIVTMNLSQLIVTFRDVGLTCMALGLVFLSGRGDGSRLK